MPHGSKRYQTTYSQYRGSHVKTLPETYGSAPQGETATLSASQQGNLMTLSRVNQALANPTKVPLSTSFAPPNLGYSGDYKSLGSLLLLSPQCANLVGGSQLITEPIRRVQPPHVSLPAPQNGNVCPCPLLGLTQTSNNKLRSNQPSNNKLLG